MASTTDLSVLKINYLTQAQYDNAKSQGTLNADEIYMTPVSGAGGVEDVEVDGVSVVTDGVAEITMPTVPTKVSDLQNDENFTSNTGTVTSVTVSNATNGGLTISGSPVTTSGTVTVGHSNVLTSAQTTQAVYPIKIDKNGHISAYGSAVTSMPASDVSSWAKESTKPNYTYSEVGAAASSHSHGNITNGGDITATAPTIANGDQIIINDNSASKITNGPTFDGSTTTKALTPKGTWETFLQSYNETDPTVSSWAKASSKPSYTASEVGYGSSNVQSALDDLYTLKVLVISVASFSSLPQTVTNASITADHVCLKAELDTPSAQTGDWTVTTSAGSLTISGSISGSTTATLYLARKEN